MASQLGEAFRSHHRELRERLDNLASQVKTEGVGALERLVRFLREELLPHARAEEAHLYPAVEPLLRTGGDPTATMRLDHEFITERVEALGAAVDAFRSDDLQDLSALQGTVVELRALFEVHLEKEERVYLPLLEKHLSDAEQDAILRAMHEASGRGG